jgi:hypothetical protein
VDSRLSTDGADFFLKEKQQKQSFAHCHAARVAFFVGNAGGEPQWRSAAGGDECAPCVR